MQFSEDVSESSVANSGINSIRSQLEQMSTILKEQTLVGLRIIIVKRRVKGIVNKRQMVGKGLKVRKLQQQGHSAKTNLQFNVTNVWGGVTIAETVPMRIR